MEKAADLGEPRWQAPWEKGDSAVSAGNTGLHSDGAVPMSAGLAHHAFTLLIPTLRLPKGTRYVVRRPDSDSRVR
jgi:hypothetical protein